VNDVCAKCDEPLSVQPLGVREACCFDIDPVTGIAYCAYWSHVVPEPRDVRGFRMITGFEMPNRIHVSTGVRQFLYRRPA
jgi:hypothetical protein